MVQRFELRPAHSDRYPDMQWAVRYNSRKKSKQDKKGQKRGREVHQVQSCSGKCTSTLHGSDHQRRA